MRTVDVVVVGLGFGEAFLPIHQDHPQVGEVGVVEPDTHRRQLAADRHGISEQCASLDGVLDDPSWDAVHVLSPVRYHAQHAVAVLASGKHCACAVPMATSPADIDAILAAQHDSGSRYRMMETSLYTREYLTTRAMHERGDLGSLPTSSTSSSPASSSRVTRRLTRRSRHASQPLGSSPRVSGLPRRGLGRASYER